MELWDVVKDLGLPVALVIFFVWQAWQRETGLRQRVEKLEEYQQQVVVKLVESTSTTIAENTVVMQRLQHMLETK
jgi:hypothetical protein